MPQNKKQEKIYIVSLGCPKNLADTEKILFQRFRNYQSVGNPEEADTIFINTCSFITSAKEESIDTILEMAEWKKKDPSKKILVTGCLWEHYQGDLEKEIPEVDFFSNKEAFLSQGRVLTTSHFAYLKIAEGCSRQCSFCTIPVFKGKHVSRPMDEILMEAASLEGKTQELILVSQDTSYYGMDLYHENKLFGLLERLSDMNFPWIRVMYFYPQNLTPDILKLIASKKNLCNYIDIPLQHLSDPLLKKMNRWGTYEDYKKLIFNARDILGESAIRSSFIVGFPGETQKDYEILLNGLEELKLDRSGFFAYSDETDAPSAQFDDKIPEQEIQKRFEQVVFISEEISEENLKQRVGKTYPAILEGKDEESGFYAARSQYEAPEIDGILLVEPDQAFTPGQWIDFTAEDSDIHNLKGRGIPCTGKK